MFAIFVNEMKSNGKKGWLKGTRPNSIETSGMHSGKQRVEPIFTDSRSKIKTWKTEGGAIRFAKTLATRLETVEFVAQRLNQYAHSMRYTIQVIDMNTNRVVHTINMYKYQDTK